MTLHSQRVKRGAALITAMTLMGIMALLVAALLMYVQKQRQKNLQGTRADTRLSCAESGLQYARAYFGRNQANWNAFLSDPRHYNPVASTAGDAGLAANVSTVAARATILAAGNLDAGTTQALFADLDGDEAEDVYIYIRDNDDEHLPAAPNRNRDNDQTVIIGAVCVSSTLVPRREDGTIDSDQFAIEGMLSYSLNGTEYGGQQNAGISGTGNMN